MVVRRRRSISKVKIAVVSIDEFDDSDIEMLPESPIVVSVTEVEDEHEEVEPQVTWGTSPQDVVEITENVPDPDKDNATPDGASKTPLKIGIAPPLPPAND